MSASPDAAPFAPAAVHDMATSAVAGLETLPRHARATVIEVRPQTEADREIALRLLEIGFLPGEAVTVIAHGFPGGEPLAVRIGSSTFALRRHEAALVRVQATGGIA